MHNRETSGSILIVVLLLAAICLTIGTGLTFLYRINNRLARNYLFETQALYLAEAGLSKAETILRKNHIQGTCCRGPGHRYINRVWLTRAASTTSGPTGASIGYVGSARQTLVSIYLRTLSPT